MYKYIIIYTNVCTNIRFLFSYIVLFYEKKDEWEIYLPESLKGRMASERIMPLGDAGRELIKESVTE